MRAEGGVAAIYACFSFRLKPRATGWAVGCLLNSLDDRASAQIPAGGSSFVGTAHPCSKLAAALAERYCYSRFIRTFLAGSPSTAARHFL